MQPMLYLIPGSQRAISDAASRLADRVLPQNVVQLLRLAAVLVSGVDRLLADAPQTAQGQLGFGPSNATLAGQPPSPRFNIDEVRRPLDDIARSVGAILGDVRVAGPWAGRVVLESVGHLACELQLALSRVPGQLDEARSTVARVGEGEFAHRALAELMRDETRLRSLTTELEQISISVNYFLSG